MIENEKKTGKKLSQKRDVKAVTFYVTSGEKEMLLGEAKLYGGTSNYIRLKLGLPPNAVGRKLKMFPGEAESFFDFELD